MVQDRMLFRRFSELRMVPVTFLAMCVIYVMYKCIANHDTETDFNTPRDFPNMPAYPGYWSKRHFLETKLNRTKRIVNSIITEYNTELNQTFQDLVAKKVSTKDPKLITLILEMMDLPSHHIIKPVRRIVKTPQNSEIINILQNKRGGFFIEAGALDGERSSNTLYLEQTMGWTGLLVEMDPYFYTQLLGKNRRSWSINACLSPHQHPTQMRFAESSGGAGKLIQDGSKAEKEGVTQTVPCFPLESLLYALNITHVDYFSLDVEGFELEILKAIPFDRLDIKTLSVEYVHGNSGKDAYRQFMEATGYRVHKDIHYHEPKIAMYVDDFIFIKN